MAGEAAHTRLAGFGLHSGSPAAVTLTRRDGPVALVGARELRVRDATVVGTHRATTIDAGGVRIGTVEHLFAAFAGLGIHEGVAIEVLGPEVPLLDGGAAAFCAALVALGARRTPSPASVARAGEVRAGDSVYTFEPGEAVKVSVAVELDGATLARHAAWEGDADDFLGRIAPARTFASAADVEELARRGLASHVTPESVVVLDGARVYSSGRPFLPDEPARHKLLDLVGDLYLYGGPPRGAVHAHRPGHRATHAAMTAAIAEGIVRPAR